MSTDTGLKPFRNEGDLRQVLAANYLKQIKNYFGNEKQALAFLSAVISATQRLPKLLECTPVSVINSFMTMAQLGFMPSGVSGEAFVLPYEKKKGSGIFEAQFQLGYQGLVTLLYGAGAKSVVAELIREKDTFELVNSKIMHKVNPLLSKEKRGPAIGAYAIITTGNGGTVEAYMHMDDIKAHAQKFSKSYASDYSPWNPESDPEGWMPRKTVLKQAGKLAPKNDKLMRAIAEDNKDSIIGDRLEAAKEDSQSLTMGNLLKDENNKDQKGKGTKKGEAQPDAPEGDAPAAEEGGLDTIQLG